MAKLYIIGVGMGNPDTLTLLGQRAIEHSTLLIGAPRLLAHYPDKNTLPLIAPQEIADCIEAHKGERIAVLLSGDVGFYSGAKKLYELLEGQEIETVAGISSPVYLAAKLRRPWQNMKLLSAHGRACNVLGEIRCHHEVFLLTGGSYTVHTLCRALIEKGMTAVTLTVGERLSYSDEAITTGTADVLLGKEFDALAVVLIDNPSAVDGNMIPLADSDFIRGDIPMTKQEIRTLVVSKLQPKAGSIIWDVGAGTGSVAIACALTAPKGRVYAIEKNADAVGLIGQNRAKFNVPHLAIIEGVAPLVLAELEPPDAVFLGGTGGNMAEILRLVLDKNKTARIVVTAVTLETVAEATRVFAALDLQNVDMVQVAVTGTRQAGRYHLFQAQNPVWIFSGEGRG